MAAPDEAVGKAMVKLPALDDLFEPKSIAAEKCKILVEVKVELCFL